MRGPAHAISLTPPADPGGKGDAGRWSLHVFHYPTGQRTPIYGLLATDYEGAKEAAAALLGYEPEWKPAGQSLIATNPEEHTP